MVRESSLQAADHCKEKEAHSWWRPQGRKLVCTMRAEGQSWAFTMQSIAKAQRHLAWKSLGRCPDIRLIYRKDAVMCVYLLQCSSCRPPLPPPPAPTLPVLNTKVGISRDQPGICQPVGAPTSSQQQPHPNPVPVCPLVREGPDNSTGNLLSWVFLMKESIGKTVFPYVCAKLHAACSPGNPPGL